jgi:hypothetical protein
MRNKLRIPICLKLFKKKEVFLKFYNNELNYKIFIKNFKDLSNFWKEYPDLRFGQMLINQNIIFDGDHWNIEETKWLINNNFIKLAEIEFWGINYSKEGKLLKNTKFKLLKDLEIDHIKNIIKFFERNNALPRLNKKYLEYFNKRINEG